MNAGIGNPYQNCREEDDMERVLARSVAEHEGSVIAIDNGEDDVAAPLALGAGFDVPGETAAASFQKPAASPEKKRTKSDRDAEFHERTFSHLSDMLLDGTPATQEATLSLMEKMGEEGNNMAKNIVKSKTLKGTPAEGESPKMALRLIETKKLVLKRANK